MRTFALSGAKAEGRKPGSSGLSDSQGRREGEALNQVLHSGSPQTAGGNWSSSSNWDEGDAAQLAGCAEGKVWKSSSS